MQLDIRLPIGMLFTLLGVIIAAFGLLSDPGIYRQSLGYNVNLWWGIVLLVFGVLMLYFGRKGTSSVRLAAEVPEGQATEQREHALGLEQPDGEQQQ